MEFGRGAWLTYVRGERGTLYALAIINQLNVHIWEQNQAGELIPIPLASGLEIHPNNIHMLHTNGLTHFNQLQEIPAAIAPVPPLTTTAVVSSLTTRTGSLTTVAPQTFIPFPRVASFDEQERAAYKSGDPSNFPSLQLTQKSWSEMMEDASRRRRDTLNIDHPTALNGGAARLQVLEIHQTIEPAYAELTDDDTYVLCGTVGDLPDRGLSDDTLEFTGEHLIMNGWKVPVCRRKKTQIMITTEPSPFQNQPSSSRDNPDEGPGGSSASTPSSTPATQLLPHPDGPPPADDQQGGEAHDVLDATQDQGFDQLFQNLSDLKKSNNRDSNNPSSGSSFISNVLSASGTMLKAMVSITPISKHLRRQI